jgi:2,4-dienoyl-CoA reductase-like NADH-dependent reductase (Old Yellow Enzyme family)
MGQVELDMVRHAFVESTRRAERLGVDVIEVHGAHGYLLHQCLSPLAHTRNDQYGGTLENRMRYPLEVFSAMRKLWPENKPMGLRLSVSKWVEGGWSPEESVESSRQLKALGCDYVCASSGDASQQQKIVLGEGYQVQFAARIRNAVDIPNMAVGLIFDPQHAERVVANGDADMIALARGLLFDPHWAVRAAAVLGAEVPTPPQYARAYSFDFLRDKEREWVHRPVV